MPELSHTLAVNLTLAVLALFSVVTWALIFSRVLRARRERSEDAAFQAAFWKAPDLAAAESLARAGSGDLARLVTAAFDALSRKNHAVLSLDSLGERKDILERTLKGQLREIQHRREYGLTVLASIGSTAPFVGLFGTVWGIMHALDNISVATSASLNVIAGPVGEALAATAFGIATAIPAVLAYNHGLRRVRTTLAGLDRFANDFLVLMVKTPYQPGSGEPGSR